jgi:hypothetical protein
MPHLYWSCQDEAVGALLQRLRELGREGEISGVANGLSVIHVGGPEDLVLEETPKLIAQRRLKTAALVSAALSHEKLFVAAEWWNRFVVETSEMAMAERIAPWLRRIGEYKLLDLIIFEVNAVGGSDAIGELDVRTVSATAVCDDPKRYYGRFTSPDIGGANALFAAGLEAAATRGLGPDTVLVGAPEVFGFDVDEGEESVIGWRQKGTIAVHAFGFALPNWRDALEQIESHSFEEGSVAGKIARWRESDIRFGLAVVLHASDDPPVVIPMGSVYQQPVMGSHDQNLAVAQPSVHNIGAGATVPLILPAWCLNPTFSFPHGPMLPTRLVATGASGTQEAVWEHVRRRYRGQS